MSRDGLRLVQFHPVCTGKFQAAANFVADDGCQQPRHGILYHSAAVLVIHLKLGHRFLAGVVAAVDDAAVILIQLVHVHIAGNTGNAALPAILPHDAAAVPIGILHAGAHIGNPQIISFGQQLLGVHVVFGPGAVHVHAGIVTLLVQQHHAKSQKFGALVVRQRQQIIVFLVNKHRQIQSVAVSGQLFHDGVKGIDLGDYFIGGRCISVNVGAHLDAVFLGFAEVVVEHGIHAAHSAGRLVPADRADDGILNTALGHLFPVDSALVVGYVDGQNAAREIIHLGGNTVLVEFVGYAVDDSLTVAIGNTGLEIKIIFISLNDLPAGSSCAIRKEIILVIAFFIPADHGISVRSEIMFIGYVVYHACPPTGLLHA